MAAQGSSTTIGFIGLGNMGAPMAKNLVAAGHSVTGFDVAGIVVDGVLPAESLAEAVLEAEVVISMLPNGTIVQQVAAEIIPIMPKGAIFVDCSTIDVDSAHRVANQCLAAGVLPMDAPVSGGIGGANAGSLTFMAGGSSQAFDKVLPLFEVMGQKAVLCGPSGSGQGTKICNNMILGVNMIGTCEAFVLGQKLGLDPQKLFDVISTSSGYSWVSNAYCPLPGVGPESPADHGYTPGFAAELMLKDLRLAQLAAQSVAADTPMGEVACQLYARFVEHEDGLGRDFSAILPRLAKKKRPTGR